MKAVNLLVGAKTIGCAGIRAYPPQVAGLSSIPPYYLTASNRLAICGGVGEFIQFIDHLTALSGAGRRGGRLRQATGMECGHSV